MKEDQTDNPYNVPEFVPEFLAQPALFHQESELNQWLQEDPGHQKLFDEYLDLWQGCLKGRKTRDYDEHKAWSRFHNSMKIVELETGRQPSFFIRMVSWRSAVAAALVALVLALAGFLAFRLFHLTDLPLTYSEYHVPYGSKSAVVLPDGSRVWLNAGSRIVIDNQFGTRNRELSLEGEAHFTVVKAKAPFRIKTAGLIVEAIGTVFNLKAYPEENIIETTVEEGTVYIFRSAAGKTATGKTVLRANQKATFIRTEGLNGGLGTTGRHVPKPSPVNTPSAAGTNVGMRISIAENIRPAIFSSWKDERWIIEREELQHLAKKLERRYNIRIVFKDESLKAYVFSGILKDETLEQVLDYVQHTAPIGFDVDQDQVTLYEVNALKSRLNQ